MYQKLLVISTLALSIGIFFQVLFQKGPNHTDMSVLGYWKIRGLAQPIRLLLNYVGEDFEDKYYESGPPPYSGESWWKNDKYKLGYDFPNLPYYKDGTVMLTQTNTILKYLGRKYNLCGSTVEEQAHVDLVLDVTMDMRNKLVMLVYGPNYSEQRDGYFKDIHPALEAQEKYLKDNDWFVGNKVTIADFHIYEMLDQHEIMEPGLLDKYPKLKAFHKRFENLPQIKSYMESDKFMRSPINYPIAGFVG